MTSSLDYARVPVRIEPVQQRGADRIAALLDTAAALIDEHGIDGLTTTMVAARSGSSVGVVYRYYPNIQFLLRALASRNMERFTARVFGPGSAESGDWHTVMDAAIAAYVELNRTEPGFRILGFGAVIDKRFIERGVNNNSVLAKAFADMFVEHYDVTPSAQLSHDFEVIVEIADALLHRAFLDDPRGDERFITTLRSVIGDFMAEHTAPS